MSYWSYDNIPWDEYPEEKDTSVAILECLYKLNETKKAILFEVRNSEDELVEIWIPKSLIIENYFDVDKTVFIAGWFYKQLIEEGKL